MPDDSFSGITAAHLVNITTTLPIVQAKLLDLFTSRSILIGHSLEQDLRALKLAHPRCVDTAVIYHHPRGRPLKPGLAWLTKKWCGREIQTRGESGHDPEEDAKACIDLLKKKLENGRFSLFGLSYALC
jgi:RNA exonuclease 1